MATFVLWFLCSIVPNRIVRGILRATIIAILCSPGILIGHGIGIAPTLFALYVQPSVFTLGSMLIVWIIALGVIFGVPALRNEQREWPLKAKGVFLNAHIVKFFFLGLIAATLMAAFVYTDDRSGLWGAVFKYGLFFAGAGINLSLCYWATLEKQANPIATPALFAAPVFLAAAPTVGLLWYGGGAVGGLLAGGHRRGAGRVALGIFSLLFLNSAYRIYAAATAPAHVTIGGGVMGNAAMAALFAVLVVASWWIFMRQPARPLNAGKDA